MDKKYIKTIKNETKSKSTSWGSVARWYDNLIEKEASNYQKDVILPNLLRLVGPEKGETILDLACGQGFFSREFAKHGSRVIGVDIAPELIKIAEDLRDKAKLKIDFYASGADSLPFIKSASIDKITVVLAIQNIENLLGTLAESARVLKPGGKMFMVMNHPAFRIPKASSWGWDESTKAQYRRVDEYMSESKVPIQMHPGQKPSEITVSFHRPLQIYFKVLKKAGFAVTGLEEWISNKKSEPGPRASLEDKARKEIPLFILLETIKL